MITVSFAPAISSPPRLLMMLRRIQVSRSQKTSNMVPAATCYGEGKSGNIDWR